jgi:hypothetical protein
MGNDWSRASQSSKANKSMDRNDKKEPIQILCLAQTQLYSCVDSCGTDVVMARRGDLQVPTSRLEF